MTLLIGLAQAIERERERHLRDVAPRAPRVRRRRRRER
jgi:hypothetical protein